MIRFALPFLLLSVCGVADAQLVFDESEPNDTRATADLFNGIDPVSGLGEGSRMNGSATGADVDRFVLGLNGGGDIQTDTFFLDRPSGGGLYGRSLTAAGTIDVASDVLVQPTYTSFLPGFTQNSLLSIGNGSSSAVDYAVTGTGGAYQSRYARYAYNAFEFGSIGTFQGRVTITAGSNTIDSDIALIGREFPYESYRPLQANNDASAATLGSRIVADYDLLPGGDTFFIAVAHRNLVTGLLPDANEFARDPNDPRTYLFDSPSAIAGSSAESVAIPLTIRDETGRSFTATATPGPYGVSLFAFRVQPAPVPEPATIAALGFGALALLRRRRRA